MISWKKEDNQKEEKIERENTAEEKFTDEGKLFESLQKCQEAFSKVEKERNEYLAGWQRERADFLNYKKEQVAIFASFQKFATENFILEILPIFDNLEIALQHLPEDLKENEWAKGIVQIRDQFKNILKNQGIEEIKTLGEKFNPAFHEAVENIESEKDEGTILEEIQKGYLLNGKVIRPARVKVAK